MENDLCQVVKVHIYTVSSFLILFPYKYINLFIYRNFKIIGFNYFELRSRLCSIFVKDSIKFHHISLIRIKLIFLSAQNTYPIPSSQILSYMNLPTRIFRNLTHNIHVNTYKRNWLQQVRGIRYTKEINKIFGWTEVYRIKLFIYVWCTVHICLNKKLCCLLYWYNTGIFDFYPRISVETYHHHKILFLKFIKIWEKSIIWYKI